MRGNRHDLKRRGIRLAGKALQRPKKVTEENHEALRQKHAKRREEYLECISSEGRFGQRKNGYRLNYIHAKLADTSVACVNSIIFGNESADPVEDRLWAV